MADFVCDTTCGTRVCMPRLEQIGETDRPHSITRELAHICRMLTSIAAAVRVASEMKRARLSHEGEQALESNLRECYASVTRSADCLDALADSAESAIMHLWSARIHSREDPELVGNGGVMYPTSTQQLVALVNSTDAGSKSITADAFQKAAQNLGLVHPERSMYVVSGQRPADEPWRPFPLCRTIVYFSRQLRDIPTSDVALEEKAGSIETIGRDVGLLSKTVTNTICVLSAKLADASNSEMAHTVQSLASVERATATIAAAAKIADTELSGLRQTVKRRHSNKH